MHFHMKLNSKHFETICCARKPNIQTRREKDTFCRRDQKRQNERIGLDSLPNIFDTKIFQSKCHKPSLPFLYISSVFNIDPNSCTYLFLTAFLSLSKSLYLSLCIYLALFVSILLCYIYLARFLSIQLSVSIYLALFLSIQLCFYQSSSLFLSIQLCFYQSSSVSFYLAYQSSSLFLSIQLCFYQSLPSLSLSLSLTPKFFNLKMRFPYIHGWRRFPHALLKVCCDGADSHMQMW